MNKFIKLAVLSAGLSLVPGLLSAHPQGNPGYQQPGSGYKPGFDAPGFQPGYGNPGYGAPGFVDQSFLVDASRDLVDALNYGTRIARGEISFALTAREAEDFRWFSDRISNTRHFVDADVVNALRAGASPSVALRLLRGLDSNFREIEQLANRLPYLSPNVENALDDIFDARARLIRLLTDASY